MKGYPHVLMIADPGINPNLFSLQHGKIKFSHVEFDFNRNKQKMNWSILLILWHYLLIAVAVAVVWRVVFAWEHNVYELVNGGCGGCIKLHTQADNAIYNVKYFVLVSKLKCCGSYYKKPLRIALELISQLPAHWHYYSDTNWSHQSGRPL